MTIPDQILHELLARPSSTNALAERLAEDPQVLHVICERHAKDGLLDRQDFCAGVSSWTLTDAGHEAADALKPATAAA